MHTCMQGLMEKAKTLLEEVVVRQEWEGRSKKEMSLCSDALARTDCQVSVP
jgi:hypothetical protein